MKRKGSDSITPEARSAIAREVSGYFQENFDGELSQFRAEMLVDYIVERIFAVVYNEALLDSRAYLTESLQEMEDSLYKSVSD